MSRPTILDELSRPRQWFEPETIYIPAGSFWMGSDPAPGVPTHETLKHEVHLAGFRIGKYLVTNAEYAQFVKKSNYRLPKRANWPMRQPPPDKKDFPVVGVSWHDAMAFCQWLSEQTGRAYRLPTEAEWEKAARGINGQIYPWDDEWHDGYCHCESNSPCSVKKYEQVASVYGCVDMLGNVQEWTTTIWGSDPIEPLFSYPYQPDDGREDITSSYQLHSVFRVYRGGYYKNDAANLRSSMREPSHVNNRLKWRGFRVVLEV